MFARRLSLPLVLFLAAVALADGPADNIPDKVRPVPPVGTEVPAADAAEIRAGLAELQGIIKDIGKHELLPDVAIYEKAVRWALDYKEVYDPPPPKKGNAPPAAANVRKVLAAGLERARQLKDGRHPWTSQTGYVLRGYRSKIDGSVQPYGLLVPDNYQFKPGDSPSPDPKYRLDFWWHGRGENLSEANFMANVQNASGIIPVPGQFILYPYGRYCNANKFAGEVDSFECLDHVKKHYRIDESRLVARGFSMGGAACWQYAVHFPTLWCANAPGAGFSETPDFLKVFQKESTDGVPWYEQKLWRMYNATDYAQNIFNLPTVAYSGEEDSQKQAADIMEKAMEKEGLKLTHIIGPKTKHAYEKGAKAEVNRRIDEIVAKGKPTLPKQIKFVTYTLRYNESGWIRVMGLEKHWVRAQVDGEIKDGTATLKTENVTRLGVLFGDDEFPKGPPRLRIDGAEFVLRSTDGGFLPGTARHVTSAVFEKLGGKWQRAPAKSEELAKKPGLQGPIDDAFMDSFVMVVPTGRSMNEKTMEWTIAEKAHALEHWRKQFRGDIAPVSDVYVTPQMIANSNLILWGDPKSNLLLAKIADKLPIKWTDKGIVVGDKTYDAATHVPVLIYPNPLNPKKYVVLNSGFTFREYDYLNNARQVSKLPDYAILDITTPANSRYPGKVVRAGFFGEKWELQKDDGK